MNYAVGECWTYRAPEGFAASRLVIGAVVSFAGHEPILCCAVTGASCRQADGSVVAATIPFLPMTLAAFRDSAVARDGSADIPANFQRSFDAWQQDGRGLSYFTVPFEGHLDRMIALQMAQIVGADIDAA